SMPELEHMLKTLDFKKFMDGDFSVKLLDLTARGDELKEKAAEIGDQFKRVKDIRHHPFQASSATSAISGASFDPDFKTVKQGLSLLTQNDFGLFPGDYFREEWVEPLIQAKTGLAYATFV